jgi:hypothetical protein
MDEITEYFLWVLGSGFVVLLFVWILKIEPYVRRRTRTSALFFLPWAPWVDYLSGIRLAHRYPSVPWFFPFFRWLTYFEIVGIIVGIALWIGW